VPQTFFDHGNAGSTEEIDWTNSRFHKLVLDVNATLTFIAPVGADGLVLEVKQEAAGGGNTITWPSNVSWPGGIAPVLTIAVNSIDMIVFVYDDDSDEFFGMTGFDFS